MNILNNKNSGDPVTIKVFENSMGSIARSFAQVQEQFARVDEHFAQIDKRFDAVDARFEQVDQRFEKIETRLDTQDVVLGKILTELVGFRRESREDRIAIGTLARNDLAHEARLAKLEQKAA